MNNKLSHNSDKNREENKGLIGNNTIRNVDKNYIYHKTAFNLEDINMFFLKQFSKPFVTTVFKVQNFKL